MLRALAIAFILVTPSAVFAGEPLFDAAKSGDTSAISRLLAQGAAVDSRARDQETPLISAALGGQAEAAILLISKGADVMARNSGGFTPLHAAAYSGSVAVAKLLLEKGAVLDDAQNKAGVTAMMVAGEQGNLEVAEFLIAQGADPRHPEIHGYLPITRAVWKGNKEIVRLYKQHGVECPDAATLGSDAWHQKCLDD